MVKDLKEWRFLPLETRDGYWNMALDEAILNAAIEKKIPYTLDFSNGSHQLYLLEEIKVFLTKSI